MKKIVHVISGLGTGGAERSLFNLLRFGSNSQFEPVVVSLRSGGAFAEQVRELGVPVVEAGMDASISGAFNAGPAMSAIGRMRPHVIQGWMYHGNAMALMARLACSRASAIAWNIRHCLYDVLDESATTRFCIRLARRFSSQPSAIVYNSELSRRQHEAFGFDESRGRVIPNGFDAGEFFRSSEMRERMRGRLGIPGGATVIGHVGRFHPVKGHALFCSVATKVAAEFPDAHFVMCGLGVSADNENLTRMIPPELLRQFHFLGEQRDVVVVLNAFDIYCQTSKSEAFPNAVAEAMLCEVPCVATDVGDTRRITGTSGFAIRAGSESELTAKVLELCDSTVDERRVLGESGRAHVLREFSMEAAADNYRELYEEIVDER